MLNARQRRACQMHRILAPKRVIGDELDRAPADRYGERDFLPHEFLEQCLEVADECTKVSPTAASPLPTTLQQLARDVSRQAQPKRSAGDNLHELHPR